MFVKIDQLIKFVQICIIWMKVCPLILIGDEMIKEKEYRDHQSHAYIDDERLIEHVYLERAKLYKNRPEFYSELIKCFKINTRTKMFGRYELAILHFEKYYSYIPDDDPGKSMISYHKMFETYGTVSLKHIINEIAFN